MWDLLHKRNTSDCRERKNCICHRSTAEHDRRQQHNETMILKTQQQLCNDQSIRHQYFCSILGPASSCTHPLQPDPALLGLYLLIPPPLFPFASHKMNMHFLGHSGLKHSSPMLATGCDILVVLLSILRCCALLPSVTLVLHHR